MELNYFNFFLDNKIRTLYLRKIYMELSQGEKAIVAILLRGFKQMIALLEKLLK